VTSEQVKATLSETLDALQRRLKDRSYKPGPIKRVWIAKDDGKQTRPWSQQRHRPDRAIGAAAPAYSTVQFLGFTSGTLPNWTAMRLELRYPRWIQTSRGPTKRLTGQPCRTLKCELITHVCFGPVACCYCYSRCLADVIGLIIQSPSPYSTEDR